MDKTYPMTEEGKKKLEEELSYLKDVKQKEVNKEVKRLRGFCDFSEDVSFKKILDEQAETQDRVDRIEEILSRLEIIGGRGKDQVEVGLGSKVKFRDLADDEEEVYMLVGSIEADPEAGKISIDSPIGKSLLGAKLDEEISIEVPSGEIKLKILEIY